ncbi:MAG TPA: SDR family NAD(P)-dependent oxidoreductase, partial [Pseudolysinimonas sp.]
MNFGNDFEGLRAVVTGGASGIGRATADLLASRGAQVAVLDLNTDGVAGPLLAFGADMGDRAAVDASLAAASQALGGLDILVNNVG